MKLRMYNVKTKQGQFEYHYRSYTLRKEVSIESISWSNSGIIRLYT